LLDEAYNDVQIATGKINNDTIRIALRYLQGRNIQAGGRFSFAATEPRNREQTGEDKDQYGAHDESAADEAAGTFGHEVFFCHLMGPFSDLSPFMNDQF
jgi:hypothetical protein